MRDDDRLGDDDYRFTSERAWPEPSCWHCAQHLDERKEPLWLAWGHPSADARDLCCDCVGDALSAGLREMADAAAVGFRARGHLVVAMDLFIADVDSIAIDAEGWHERIAKLRPRGAHELLPAFAELAALQAAFDGIAQLIAIVDDWRASGRPGLAKTTNAVEAFDRMVAGTWPR